MSQRAVVIAWCSPIDRPVRGSSVAGVRGARSAGRTFANALTRWPNVLAWLASSSARRRPSLTAMGASDTVSEPPATPDSTWPRRILFATAMVASRPVAHACWRS
ncbi:Uncharacterised protein [Mycobacteroides abscessus]|nr:Uncharacterised protein [Mycobacteroides abscessus]